MLFASEFADKAYKAAPSDFVALLLVPLVIAAVVYLVVIPRRKNRTIRIVTPDHTKES
jgi:hypothetical protein